MTTFGQGPLRITRLDPAEVELHREFFETLWVGALPRDAKEIGELTPARPVDDCWPGDRNGYDELPGDLWPKARAAAAVRTDVTREPEAGSVSPRPPNILLAPGDPHERHVCGRSCRGRCRGVRVHR